MEVEQLGTVLEPKIQECRRDRSDFREIKAPSQFRDKIPRQLRDMNEKAYEPEVVSIGPYYHGRDELKEMEELKVSYMNSLLNRKPEVTREGYKESIEPVVQSALDCYGEALSLKRDEFIDMLVLDGCFIIQLIIESNGQGNATYIRSRLRNNLQRDLLLLENQIPFFVLGILYNIINRPDDKGILLMKDVLLFFGRIFPEEVLHRETLKRNPNEVRHILDLIHFNWCFQYKSSVSVLIRFTSTRSVSKHNSDMNTSPLVIPSASRLKQDNVKFKKKSFYESDNWLDVKFVDGKLVLPMLVIDGETESLLRNLIAYEQLLPNKSPTHVTDYALLLDNLINDATDVQILSKYKIIDNRLGSDEDVAEFVNRLTYKIIYSNNNFRYKDIFYRINAYYHKRKLAVYLNSGTDTTVCKTVRKAVRKVVRKAVDEFREKYFSSLWSFIAVVATTMLLLLTAAQTVFAALEHFQRP